MSTKDNHTPAVSASRESAKKKPRGEYGKSYVKIALIATISVLVCIQLVGML